MDVILRLYRYDPSDGCCVVVEQKRELFFPDVIFLPAFLPRPVGDAGNGLGSFLLYYCCVVCGSACRSYQIFPTIVDYLQYM